MPAFLPGRLEVGIVVDQTPFISGPDLATRCENIGQTSPVGLVRIFDTFFVWM